MGGEVDLTIYRSYDKGGIEGEEESVGSYWMTLRKGEDTSEGGSFRSHCVESSLCTCRETDY
jgi:hypothetical protein